MVATTGAVETGVNREKKITEMKLERLKESVDSFEDKYDMNSEKFRQKFESGELGDDEDFMKWDVYLDLIEELEQKIDELSRFKE